MATLNAAGAEIGFAGNTSFVAVVSQTSTEYVWGHNG